MTTKPEHPDRRQFMVLGVSAMPILTLGPAFGAVLPPPLPVVEDYLAAGLQVETAHRAVFLAERWDRAGEAQRNFLGARNGRTWREANLRTHELKHAFRLMKAQCATTDAEAAFLRWCGRLRDEIYHGDRGPHKIDWIVHWQAIRQAQATPSPYTIRRRKQPSGHFI